MLPFFLASVFGLMHHLVTDVEDKQLDQEIKIYFSLLDIYIYAHILVFHNRLA